MKVINGFSLKTKHKYFLECATIHSKEIPNGFLPTLGLNFLSSLYEVFSKSKHSFLLLAIEDDKVIGFIAISLHTKFFFKQYLKTKLFKSLYKIPIVIFGKVFFIKSLNVFKYFFSNKRDGEIFISNSEIFNFCISSLYQGRGTGQLLFLSAVEQLKVHNIKILKIVTGQSQKSAQNFYYKIGATPSHKIIIHNGKESVVFKYKING